jgi:hypothetical protein
VFLCVFVCRFVCASKRAPLLLLMLCVCLCARARVCVCVCVLLELIMGIGDAGHIGLDVCAYVHVWLLLLGMLLYSFYV